MTQTILRTSDDIKHYFRHQKKAYHFVSATNFNVMDMHRWVNNWNNINFIDCFDGKNPKVFKPDYVIDEQIENGGDVTAFLLKQKSVRDLLGEDAKLLSLFSSPLAERRASKLGVDHCRPSYDLANHIDSKIVTTQLGNEAGVKSVPNCLVKAKSYDQLCKVADKHDLGRDWVIQLPYGDSGKTTFFIKNKKDYQEVADKILAVDKVKLMKRIRCTGSAIEAVATRWGTYVGPLLTELIGAQEVTPYAGGWCGNEYRPEAFSASIRQQAQAYTERLGEAIYKTGYRGYFEVDYLIDLDDGAVYLGEINPRFSGVTQLTNTTPMASGVFPLMLMHLLEFNDDVDLEMTPDTFHHEVEQHQTSESVLSQLIIKHTDETLKFLVEVPQTGIYKINETGHLDFLREANTRAEVTQTDEVFVLSIAKQEEYAYYGMDLAIVFLNQQIHEQGQLTDRAKKCVQSVKSAFECRDLDAHEYLRFTRYTAPDSGKV